MAGNRTLEVPINPKILVWARETLNLSVEDAAEAIGVEKSILEQWERGEKRPSFAQLKKIGTIYKRTTAVFLLPSAPQDPPVPKDYRVLDEKAESRLSPSTFIEIRKAQKKREYALELFELAGQELPTFKWKLNLSHDPEKAGQQWRKQFGVEEKSVGAIWKNEYEALNFWKKSIESLGVLVFQASLDSLDELRGLAVYDKNLPLILLNTKDSPRGRIFSLLHEFCHLLLQRSGIGNMEPSFKKNDQVNNIEIYCNAFAAACLLPIEKFTNEIASFKISNSQIANALFDSLSKKYQVSWEVVLRRLLTAGKISQATYRSTREEFKASYQKAKKADGGFADYLTKMLSYNGEPFIGLVLDNFGAGNISVSEATDFLGIKANHFPELQSQLQMRKRRA